MHDPCGGAVTSGGSLRCQVVIHAVGPVWRGGHLGEEKELYDAVMFVSSSSALFRFSFSFSISSLVLILFFSFSHFFPSPSLFDTRSLLRLLLLFFYSFPSDHALFSRNSLKAAQERNLESIALPAISSGIFGFPKPLCAKIMFQAAIDFSSGANRTGKKPSDIRFVNFDDATVSVFLKEMQQRFPGEFKDSL